MKEEAGVRVETGPAAPWTNVYGLARSLLALGTLVDLCSHDVDLLFRPLGVELREAASSISTRFHKYDDV